jgi:aminopeptidase N
MIQGCPRESQDGENILRGTVEDPFIRGVHTYLRAHSFNTSTSAALWEAMSSAVGRNVGAWMHQWTYEKGYPLVHVQLGGLTNRDVTVVQVAPLSFPHRRMALSRSCAALCQFCMATSEQGGL